MKIITDCAADMSAEERIELDNTYADKCSFWFDLKIILLSQSIILTQQKLYTHLRIVFRKNMNISSVLLLKKEWVFLKSILVGRIQI